MKESDLLDIHEGQYQTPKQQQLIHLFQRILQTNLRLQEDNLLLLQYADNALRES